MPNDDRKVLLILGFIAFFFFLYLAQIGTNRYERAYMKQRALCKDTLESVRLCITRYDRKMVEVSSILERVDGWSRQRDLANVEEAKRYFHTNSECYDVANVDIDDVSDIEH